MEQVLLAPGSMTLGLGEHSGEGGLVGKQVVGSRSVKSWFCVTFGSFLNLWVSVSSPVKQGESYRTQSVSVSFQ